jgi:hypothetical protein
MRLLVNAVYSMSLSEVTMHYLQSCTHGGSGRDSPGNLATATVMQTQSLRQRISDGVPEEAC